MVIEPDIAGDEGKRQEKGMFEKAALLTLVKGKPVPLNVVTRDFLKKYISFAKAQRAPEINQDCVEYAAQYYSALRTKALNYDQSKVSVPITVRTLETMIRLATAHAKLRLSKQVEGSDIDVACVLLNNSIFQQNIETTKDEEGDSDEEEEHHKPAGNGAAKNGTRSARKGPVKKDEDDEDFHEEEKKGPVGESVHTRAARMAARNLNKVPSPKPSPQKAPPPKKESPAKQTPKDEEPASKRLKVDHEEQVAQLFQANNVEASFKQKRLVFKLVTQHKDASQSVRLDALWKAVMALPEKEVFERGRSLVESKKVLIEIVQALEQDNSVMYSPEDGNVVLI